MSQLHPILQKAKDTLKRCPFKHNVILSIGDTDALFCGMYVQKVFGSKIVGYIKDNEIMYVDPYINPKEVLYLDIEILQKEIYSVGNHINFVQPDTYLSPTVNEKITNCVNLNMYLKRSMKGPPGETFRNKYPFGSIHILAATFGNPFVNDVILYWMLSNADGSQNNLFREKYMQNTDDWLTYFSGTVVGDWGNAILHQLTGAEIRKIVYYLPLNREKQDLSEPHTFREIAQAAYNELKMEFPEEAWTNPHGMKVHRFRKETQPPNKKHTPIRTFENPAIVSCCVIDSNKISISTDLSGEFNGRNLEDDPRHKEFFSTGSSQF